MEATFRVSVRDLVSFTYFPPDLSPGGNTAEMLAGAQAHQARESAQAAEFVVEKPIRGDVALDGACVTVFGRMDAYRDGDPPCVEEIKLAGVPPREVLPEHRSQALVYAALLAREAALAAVEVRVVYVNPEGEPLKVFAERAERAALEDMLLALVRPWLAFAVPERERAAARDESLRALAFPYPAYRAGQRELAVQVYTAIARKKRLFASLPTGTGKSVAVLFPALKALAEGKTRKLIYLTARATARQSPLQALERMRAQGAILRVSTLTAKEKLCPAPGRCHPDDCPRARGHYLRQADAVRRLLQTDCAWTDDVIVSVADEHTVCPFELALKLTELADVVLMDINYAFDPFAQVIRLFKRRKDFTLLADEAHHLLERVRDSHSGALDTRALRTFRASLGKALGRKHAAYRELSALLMELKALQAPDTGVETVRERAEADRTDPQPRATRTPEETERQADAQPEDATESATAPVPARIGGTGWANGADGTGKPHAMNGTHDTSGACRADETDKADGTDEAYHHSGNHRPDGADATGKPYGANGVAQPVPANAQTRTLRGAEAETDGAYRRWEARLDSPPEAVLRVADALCGTLLTLLETRLPSPACRQDVSRLVRLLAPFLYAGQHFDERYAALLEGAGRERALELYCLSPAEVIAQVTKGLRGSVFFSATLSPLTAMRSLLGGEEGDACFSLPSPFPAERLMVVRRRIQTRYAFREASAARVAQSILEAVNARPGHYIAYFPSYAYLRLVLAHLEGMPLPPLLVQENEMSDEARERFLAAFTRDRSPRLGLCVLGGSFSEGVDLPGDQLVGALVVGVGLPTPSLRLKTLQAFYQERFGDGFLYAWMIPAMQKVLQAGGRVIRTERDKGLVLLMDDRYYDPRYRRLLPAEWQLRDEDVQAAARALDGLEET